MDKTDVVYEIGLINEPLVIKKGGHQDQLSSSVWDSDRFRVQSLEKIIKLKKLIVARRYKY